MGISINGGRKKKDPMRYVFGVSMTFAIAAIIIIIGLASAALKYGDLRRLAGQPVDEPGTAAASNAGQWQTAEGEGYALVIDEQEPGTSVMLDTVQFAREGWVVFHADKDGKPGVVLSAYRFNAGEVKGWNAPLIDGVSLAAGGTYHAMVHGDDGDRRFNLNQDTPVMDKDGNPMVLMFTVK